MGLTVHRPALEAPAGGLIADRRLYIDRTERRLLEEGSPEVAFLLSAKGQPIPADVVSRLELRMVDGRVVQGPEPDPEIVTLEEIVHTAATPEPEPEPAQEVPLAVEPPIAPVLEPEARRRRGARG